MTQSEALRLATEAMAQSTRAAERIASHERLCAWRWGILSKLMGSTLAAVLAALGLLMHDKFF